MSRAVRQAAICARILQKCLGEVAFATVRFLDGVTITVSLTERFVGETAIGTAEQSQDIQRGKHGQTILDLEVGRYIAENEKIVRNNSRGLVLNWRADLML